jgi:hypothetical protein
VAKATDAERIARLHVPDEEDVPAEVKELWAPSLEKLGFVPNVLRVFALRPRHLLTWWAYYDELLPRIRPGGLLLVDNTLWSGAVLDGGDTSDNTVAIRALNDRIAADPRARVVLLPIGDGLTVVQRVSPA